jgi:hypothetical protein
MIAADFEGYQRLVDLYSATSVRGRVLGFARELAVSDRGPITTEFAAATQP